MPYRILIVDDEDDVRKLLRLSLQKQYEVVEATDGEDTLAKVDYVEPDLITLDVMMPDYSGFEVCHLIRKKPRFEKTPIIIFSALSDKESHKGGYEAGANLYLTKTISPELFIRNVDFLISQSYRYLLPKKYTIEQLDTQFPSGKVVGKSVKKEVKRDYSEEKPEEKTIVAPLNTKPVSIVPESAPPKQVQMSSARYRILVVDDDDEVLDILRILLKEEFEVITTPDGLEAVTKIMEYEPDLIVLDIMLPNFSGYQIKQTMDKVEQTRNTPVIFLTAKSDIKSKAFAEKLNPAAYITKPFEPLQLKKNVEGILKCYYPVPKVKNKSFSEVEKIEFAKNEMKKRKREERKVKWDIEH